jgi:hypothetical protein
MLYSNLQEKNWKAFEQFFIQQLQKSKYLPCCWNCDCYLSYSMKLFLLYFLFPYVIVQHVVWFDFETLGQHIMWDWTKLTTS